MSGEKPVKVTVSDPETGEILAETIIKDNYVLIPAGDCYLAHTTTHLNGTVQLTIMRAGR